MRKISTDTTGDAQAGPTLDEHVGYLLRVAYQKASGNLARHLQGTGLSVPRYAVLARLLERGPLTQNRLGRLVAMEPANIHDMVRSLQAQRLVQTRPDPTDNRRRLVELTAEGADLAARATGIGDRANDEMLLGLAADERSDLVRLLRRFIDGC